MTDSDRYEEYMFNLAQAHVYAERALDVLYDHDGPKRSLLHRMRLGKAQSILIGLYVKEVNRKGKENE